MTSKLPVSTTFTSKWLSPLSTPAGPVNRLPPLAHAVALRQAQPERGIQRQCNIGRLCGSSISGFNAPAYPCQTSATVTRRHFLNQNIREEASKTFSSAWLCRFWLPHTLQAASLPAVRLNRSWRWLVFNRSMFCRPYQRPSRRRDMVSSPLRTGGQPSPSTRSTFIPIITSEPGVQKLLTLTTCCRDPRRQRGELLYRQLRRSVRIDVDLRYSPAWTGSRRNRHVRQLRLA